MTQAGAAAEVADVRARVSDEAAAAADLYRAAMLQPAAAGRVAFAIRLRSGWVSLQGFAGPEINAPRYSARARAAAAGGAVVRT